MRTALLRADGSRDLGMGHIFTSLTLAKGLWRRGVQSIFVVKDHTVEVPKLIKDSGFTVRTIPVDATLREDIQITRDLIEQYAPEIVVADLYHDGMTADLQLYLWYLTELRKVSRFLVILDYINPLEFPADILLNAYYGASHIQYPMKGDTQALLGPSYFLLREEFVAAGARRRVRACGRNILVTLGGSDASGLAHKTAQALNYLKRPDLQVIIVVGMDYSTQERQELQETLTRFPGKASFLGATNRLAELMLWCDVAVTGGGLTKYETAVTGTPSLVLCQAEHQVALMETFAEAGTALSLGLGTDVCAQNLAEDLESLLGDQVLRKQMSHNGKKLLDGNGLERVLDAIWAHPKAVDTLESTARGGK